MIRSYQIQDYIEDGRLEAAIHIIRKRFGWGVINFEFETSLVMLDFLFGRQLRLIFLNLL